MKLFSAAIRAPLLAHYNSACDTSPELGPKKSGFFETASSRRLLIGSSTMTDPPHGPVTQLLDSVKDGDEAAKAELWAVVYEELHGMARGYMARERGNHTLQATALVHEAYARLLGSEQIHQRGRSYFFAAAAQAMRRILIEHARRQPSDRPGHLAIDPVLMPEGSDADIETLDRALDQLAKHDHEAHEVVMLRFFAGLSVEAAAETLETSERTIKRRWAYGRTWLFQELTREQS